MATAASSSSLPSLPPPSPKSPPDLYGKRRDTARLHMLDREITFLEVELKNVEALQPASACCKEVADFVVANSDPLLPSSKKNHRSCRFWKWLCGLPCLNLSWICCCCFCCEGFPVHLKLPSCHCCRPCSCCSCSCNCLPSINCSLPKWLCCCLCPTSSSNCCKGSNCCSFSKSSCCKWSSCCSCSRSKCCKWRRRSCFSCSCPESKCCQGSCGFGNCCILPSSCSFQCPSCPSCCSCKCSCTCSCPSCPKVHPCCCCTKSFWRSAFCCFCC
ncbi:guanine nucleotide-binding protein subunit gamma 3 isoform X2 [Arachis duranensis]|uniref:Guanine nucleotide-binding protein subunit gamma 3 isoform X2 n=1 Tax=Arachis duranensis TaxID=130453 RepID=A0A6P4BV94_ARADU|nr:guanine nucleotide-binding protein subunit gamma 3 isoform X2 [Arachis duranensis]